MDSTFLVDLNMREYETLRTEINSTIERQYSLVNWGVSATVVIVVGIISGWDKITSIPGMIHVILLFIVPSIMTAYVISWAHVITKINQLGTRLYEIEQNIARAINKELIQKTYCLHSIEDAKLHHFTIGWEHKLWKDGINFRIRTTIITVKIALAVIYCGFITLSILLMLHQNFNHNQITAFMVGSVTFWFVIWVLVFQYLRVRKMETEKDVNAN